MSVTELPDFPWDSLAAYKERAAAHRDGIADLSVGTPVDATPAVVSDFLTEPDTWAQPLRRVAARHETIAVEIIDPRELSLPDVGLLSPATSESRVDLPHPLGPTIPMMEPSGTSKFRFWSTGTPSEYSNETSETSSRGGSTGLESVESPGRRTSVGEVSMNVM